MGLNKKHLNAAELQEFLDEKKILPADPMTPYIVKAELDVDGHGRMKYNILMTSRHLIEEHLILSTAKAVQSWCAATSLSQEFFVRYSSSSATGRMRRTPPLLSTGLNPLQTFSLKRSWRMGRLLSPKPCGPRGRMKTFQD